MRKISSSIISFLILVAFSLPVPSITVAAQTKPAGLLPVPDGRAAKITADMKALPANFIGHDISVLYTNLRAMGNAPAGNPVYGQLTAGDLFAFSDYSIPPSNYVRAFKTGEERFIYRGSLWRLRPGEEFPEPEIRHIQGCYGSGNGVDRKVELREKLITPFAGDAAAAWKEAFFPIDQTSANDKRSDYKGYNVGRECEEFFVPLFQAHYGLSFIKEQPFRLVKVEEIYNFSLNSYRNDPVSGPGIVTWSGDDVFDRTAGDPTPLFIVKLVSPYTGSKTFAKQDPVEKKTHTAVQRKVYVELVGVWLYNVATGKILSKEAIEKLP